MHMMMGEIPTLAVSVLFFVLGVVSLTVISFAK
jgi:hypothetical protein